MSTVLWRRNAVFRGNSVWRHPVVTIAKAASWERRSGFNYDDVSNNIIILQVQRPCELKLPWSCPSTVCWVSEKSLGRTDNYIEENVCSKGSAVLLWICVTELKSYCRLCLVQQESALPRCCSAAVCGLGSYKREMEVQGVLVLSVGHV